MTLAAGIRATERLRQVGTRDAQAVVLAGMDHHVVLRRHVAGHALGALAAGLVVVVPGGVEFGGVVAARTQRIALGTQLQGMRLMTVHARDAVLVHPALQEGAPDVNLLALLTVGVVVGRGQHGQPVAVFERRVRLAFLAQRRAAGVAGRAGVHAGAVGRLVAHGNTGIAGREFPGLVPARSQRRQALVAALCRVGWPGIPRPVDMQGTLAVAGLAGDIDFAVGRLVGVAGRSVTLLQIGRMAFGALQRPVLVAAGPVQRILVIDLLALLKMEPALATLILRPRIPGDG
jgi:hypothetical protein